MNHLNLYTTAVVTPIKSKDFKYKNRLRTLENLQLITTFTKQNKYSFLFYGSSSMPNQLQKLFFTSNSLQKKIKLYMRVSQWYARQT